MTNNLRAFFIALLIVATGTVAEMTSRTTASGLSADFMSPTQSALNEVPDFYAEGTSGSYSLKISPKGGYLKSSGPTITFMPWSYVSTQWSIGIVYIIFLVNVTETDFYVGFLYLTNSSTPFFLRTFEYEGARINTLTFNGVQYVFARSVATESIMIPKLNLYPRAQSSNTLSAIGPELYVNGNYGKIINGSTSLNVFPIRNQYFEGASDYNELWSLLTDNNGNYFFSILYMPNNDPNHVIMEHQLRLNDYKKLGGRTFDVKWSNGPFQNRLTVKMPVSEATIKVDGFQIETDSKGTVSIYVPDGTNTVEVPDEIAVGADMKLLFSSWDKYASGNPLDIDIESALYLTANYNIQYQLTIESEYGEAHGRGWYAEGANVTFSVQDTVTADNETRRIFDHWAGDVNSTVSSGWVIMDSPKDLIAVWETQFRVKLQLSGVPPNSSATIVVNDQPLRVEESKPSALWIDSNSQLMLQVQSTHIQGNYETYSFGEMRVGDQLIQPPIAVTGPITVMIVYSARPKIQSAMDLSANPDTVVSGYPLSIRGSLKPRVVSSTVSLTYSVDNVTWQPLVDVTTDTNGGFSYTWTPDRGGMYYVKGSWSGDADHTPASTLISVRVQEVALPDLRISDDLAGLLKNLEAKASSLPIVSGLSEFAASLLLLGSILAVLLFPGGPPIVGYIIGSVIVGFVYIFPISAIVLSVRAVKSRRAPRAVWLTPLAITWVVALAILMSNGAFLVAPVALIEASTILLLATNALFVPLVLSVLLARAVAR